MAVHHGRNDNRRPGVGGPGVGGASGIPQDVADRLRGGQGGGGYGAGGASGAWGAGFANSPPWEVKPPDGSDFNIDGTLAARTSANTPAELASFQVPANNVGVIRAVSILANGLLVTSDVRWILKFNDAAKTGWNNLTIAPRAAGSVEVSWTPEETYIHVPEGTTVAFDVQVNDAGSYQVSVVFHGWFYSSVLYDAARASYGA